MIKFKNWDLTVQKKLKTAMPNSSIPRGALSIALGVIMTVYFAAAASKTVRIRAYRSIAFALSLRV